MNEKTLIKSDGLRYSNKQNGSPFGTAISYVHSCIKCGKHRPRAVLTVQRLAGTNFYRCADRCGSTELASEKL